jgi:4-diphosphocytidyl-2-C-methyl-D-erythritol kinase
MPGEAVSCPAPAKLNLFLHVIGRRPDGYHLLQTLFRFLDFGDTLTFAVREDAAVRHLNPIPGVVPEQDLCVRAARLLQAETGTQLGVDIGVAKHIPMGGGLGGGSSDAATTLVALNRLWRLGLSRARLQALGLKLGADVPVFVFGRSAFAEGIGEELQPVVGLPETWYLVLVPPVAVPTAAVFSDPELTRNSDPIKILGFSAGVDRAIAYEALCLAAKELSGGGVGRNDLEAVVCRKYPAVQAHLHWLREQAPAAMSGSGACVFAAFDEESAARRAYQGLPQGMRGFVARGIDRHPLYDWA